MTVGMPMVRLVIGLMLLALTAGGAVAQETRIAAVVNDDVISLNDLDARIKLVLLSSQLPDTPQVRQRVTPQVLRALIDESLELQEAKRFNVAITDQAVNQAFDRLEQQNNMPKGGLDQLLTSRGIPRSTLVAQITATLAWNKLVDGRLAPNVSVSDEEINETMARIKDSIGKPQSRVGEIFLAVDNPTQEPEVKSLADRLVEQIRNGANFSAVAQQFSQVADRRGRRRPRLGAAERAAAGSRSRPWNACSRGSCRRRSAAAWWLLSALSCRPPGSRAAAARRRADHDDARRLRAPARRQRGRAPESRRRGATGERTPPRAAARCSRSASSVSPQISGEIRDVKIGTLPAELRPTIEALKVAEASKPLVLKDGVGVLMVCERKDPPSPIADPRAGPGLADAPAPRHSGAALSSRSSPRRLRGHARMTAPIALTMGEPAGIGGEITLRRGCAAMRVCRPSSPSTTPIGSARWPPRSAGTCRCAPLPVPRKRRSCFGEALGVLPRRLAHPVLHGPAGSRQCPRGHRARS